MFRFRWRGWLSPGPKDWMRFQGTFPPATPSTVSPPAVLGTPSASATAWTLVPSKLPGVACRGEAERATPLRDRCACSIFYGSEIHLSGDEQVPQLQAVPTTGAGLDAEWAQNRPWLKQKLWTAGWILKDQLKDIALSGYQAHLQRRTNSALRIALATGRVGGACFSTPVGKTW